MRRLPFPSPATLLLAVAIVLLPALVLLPRLLVVHAEEAPPSGAAPYAPFLPALAPENVVSLRVLALENATLAPVKGAHVTGWSEPCEDAVLPRARLLAEGIADEHGFVNITLPSPGEAPYHWLVEAPGKAVRTFAPTHEVLLARGAPYALRVLAPLGKPLPGAQVEYYIYGCPHSPAARFGKTNAAGELVFDGLPDPSDPNADPHNEWGQFWITAPGVEPGPYCVPRRRLDGAPTRILTNVGRSAQGVIRDEADRPLAGIVVRGAGYPRGPATTTDEQGRFRLLGVSPEESLTFHDPKDVPKQGPNASVRDLESDIPIRLTLHSGRSSVLGEGEEHRPAEVEVSWRSSPGAEPSPANDIPVRMVRLSDGLAVAGETGETIEGCYSPPLPPGRYRIIVGGGFSPGLETRREIDLPLNEPARFLLDPSADLVLRGLDPKDPEWVWLRLPSGSATAAGRDRNTLHLPATETAVIVLERDGPLLLPVGPLVAGQREALVPAPTPTLVHLRIRSADPKRALEYAEARWSDDRDSEEEEAQDARENRLTLCTYRRGRREITIGAPGFQDKQVPVRLEGQSRTFDLGQVLLEPLRPRRLRVLHGDGSPTSGLSLYWGTRGQRGNELQEEDKTFALELGPRPVPAILRGDGIFPLPLLLSSKDPTELRLPQGRITLHVRDAKGQPLESVAYLDHVEVRGTKGVHTLRGIPPGTHTIIVGARNHVGAVQRIELQAGMSRNLTFTLSPR